MTTTQKKTTTTLQKKQKRKRVLTNSITKTHTQTLQNGAVLTTEEKLVDFQSLETQSKIVLDTQEEYKQSVLTSEQEVLSRLPIAIINKNKYLKWRVSELLDTTNRFHRLSSNSQSFNVTELFKLCHNQIPGTGFLARFSWEVCWDYGILLYSEELNMEKAIARATTEEELHCHLQNVGLNESEFLNDRMSSILIDKILLQAYYTDNTPVWPICVSGIPEVMAVNWCSADVKVIKGAEFIFPVDDRLPHYLFQWRLTPPERYFPLDLMLLLPEYKNIFQLQLEEDRKEVLEHKHMDAGYQLYLADRVKQRK
jgi:hypothetical protein